MRLLIEERGEFSFTVGRRKHTLSCYADRIEITGGDVNIRDYKSGNEITSDGASIYDCKSGNGTANRGVNICDYKSGAMPLANEVIAGKKPQLPLEALILREGGFEDVAKDTTRLDSLTYISTRTRETLGAELDVREIVPKDGTLDDLVEESFQGLKCLLNAYLDEAQPYLCRPREESRGYAGDYDHLARLLEWSSAASDGDGWARPPRIKLGHPTRRRRHGSELTPVAEKPMCWFSGCCDCCWRALHPRRYCA